MDRCALFVDAGYVLTDGAMAAHGSNQREAVAWDYAGLLRYLAGLAVDRTGLSLLRCYWYEATVDGRRTSEHDTLADLPGLTLRLGRMRPGKREGVDTEIHRDLTTLARNRAVSDVVLVSAEDDLAQVIADVQDLGVRVIIVHISVDGNWTLSRALRQQCDDIVEIQGAQLRPFAESAGGEPARYSEQYAASVYGGRPMSNGHAASVAGGGHQVLPSGTAGAHPAPPAIYTAPVVAEYQQPPAAPPAPPRREQQPEPAPATENETPARGAHGGAIAGASASQPNQAIIGHLQQPQHSHPQQAQPPQAQPQHAPPPQAQPQHAQPQQSPAQHSQPQPAQQLYAAPPAQSPAAPPAAFREPPTAAPPPAPAPPPGPAQPHSLAPRPSAVPDAPSSQSQPGPASASPQDQRASSPRSPYEGPTSTSSFIEPPGSQFSPAPPGPLAPPERFGGTPTSLPNRRTPQPLPQHQPQPQGPPSQNGPGRSRGQQAPPPASAGFVPPQTHYGAGSRQAPSASLPPAPSSQAASSADETVQAAHNEGFEFGESVARDAPALWLEAVLARKPRMPTDLEARLLQGSALPIDSLLHDEVRHALRRGFWDALERSRR